MKIGSFAIGLLLGAVGVICLEASSAVVSWLHRSEAVTPPPLLRDMPRENDQIAALFARRVAARFPIGSDETELVKELITEEFEPKWSLPGERHAAVYVDAGQVCRNEWRIWWSADDTRRITSIQALYAPICL